MLIRFKNQRVTPTKTYLCGREYDLSETEARHWIADGVADASDAAEVQVKALDGPPADKSIKAPARKKSNS